MNLSNKLHGTGQLFRQVVEELLQVGVRGQFHLLAHSVSHHVHAAGGEVHQGCYLLGCQPHTDVDGEAAFLLVHPREVLLEALDELVIHEVVVVLETLPIHIGIRILRESVLQGNHP